MKASNEKQKNANPEDERVVEAMTTKNSTVPHLSLYRKDHKVILDPTIGPKRRPVVSASEGPNVSFKSCSKSVEQGS